MQAWVLGVALPSRRTSTPHRWCCGGAPDKHRPTCFLHGSMIRAKSDAAARGLADARAGLGLGDEGVEEP